jgi:hypothetical protein
VGDGGFCHYCRRTVNQCECPDEETGGGSLSQYLIATPAVLLKLKAAVERHGGIRPAAKVWKMSPSHLSRVLRGEKELHDSLANHVGYWREIWWREHD